MRLLVDENFNHAILQGLRQRCPEVTITQVQETSLSDKFASEVLSWAVQQGYLVLTHDINTLGDAYHDRQAKVLPVPGLLLVHGTSPVQAVIESLELIIKASQETEWQGEIRFLPL